MEHLCHLLAI